MKIILLSFTVYFSLISANAAVIVVKHMADGNKCIVCHNPSTPHQLLMRDGSKVELAKVDLLCGQCHGIKHRKWLNGMHGKVVNSWKASERTRLSCIVCHDPHSPKFPKFEAKAPPKIRKH